MGIRVVKAWIAVASVGIAGSAVAAGSGCETTPDLATSDASAVTPPADAQRQPPPDDATAPTCTAACEEDHPTGLVKDRALVACWEAHCRASCIAPSDTSKASDAADAGDAGDAGAAAPACSSAVVTVNADCTACTETSCCAVWDACFQDPDCTALNQCYQACAR